MDADPSLLGRLYLRDDRDQNFPMSAATPDLSAIPRRYRYWFPNGYWGDQKRDPHCVAYAWLHKVADGPRTTRRNPAVDVAPAMNPRALYCAAQKIDPWPGDCENHKYEGTSVRAGAKVLKDAGAISGYRWAWDAATTVAWLLEVGPVVAGTTWTADMFNPDSDGVIHPTGSSAGGHAYIINGVNRDTGMLRIKNSWGRAWSKNGYAWISISDFDDLLSDRGEVCSHAPN